MCRASFPPPHYFIIYLFIYFVRLFRILPQFEPATEHTAVFSSLAGCVCAQISIWDFFPFSPASRTE